MRQIVVSRLLLFLARPLTEGKETTKNTKKSIFVLTLLYKNMPAQQMADFRKAKAVPMISGLCAKERVFCSLFHSHLPFFALRCLIHSEPQMSLGLLAWITVAFVCCTSSYQPFSLLRQLSSGGLKHYCCCSLACAFLCSHSQVVQEDQSSHINVFFFSVSFRSIGSTGESGPRSVILSWPVGHPAL